MGVNPRNCTPNGLSAPCREYRDSDFANRAGTLQGHAQFNLRRRNSSRLGSAAPERMAWKQVLTPGQTNHPNARKSPWDMKTSLVSRARERNRAKVVKVKLARAAKVPSRVNRVKASRARGKAARVPSRGGQVRANPIRAAKVPSRGSRDSSPVSANRVNPGSGARMNNRVSPS
jgi:hypothetical protein